MADLATMVVQVTGKGIPQTQAQLNKLSREGKNTESTLKSLGKSSDGLNESFTALPGAMKSVTSGMGAMIGVMAGATFVALASDVLAYGDSLTRLENKLKLVTAGQQELDGAMQTTYRIAQESRAGWGDTVELYSRLARSTKELGVSQERVAEVTKTISQLVQASGGTAQEASAGIIQLSQGFASGRLQGDELRSVLENLPAVARALARELGVTVGELRKLGSEGELTGDKLFKAFEGAADSAQEELDKTTVLFEQATTRWGNLIDKTFKPITTKFSESVAEELNASAERWENNIALFKALGDTITWGDLFAKSNEELVKIIHETDQLAIVNNKINVLMKERNSAIYQDEKDNVQAQIDALKLQKTELEEIAKRKAAIAAQPAPVVDPNLDEKTLAKVNDQIAQLSMSAAEYKKYQFDKEFEKLRKSAKGVTPEMVELRNAFESFQAKVKQKEAQDEIKKVDSVVQDLQDRLFELTHTAQENEIYQVQQWYNAKAAVIGYTDELEKARELEIQKITKTYDDKELKKQLAAEKANQQSILNNELATAQERIAVINSMYDSKVAAAEKYGLSTVSLEAERSLKIQEIWDQDAVKHGDMIDGFIAGTKEYTKEAQTEYQRAKTAGLTMARSLESGLNTFFDVTGKGWEDWGNTATNVINDVLNAILQATVVSPLTESIVSGIGSISSSFFSSSSGTTDSSWMNNQTWSRSAKGNVFSGGNISDYSGAIVSSPTFFSGGQNKAYAKGGNLMGEAGPEAILPLTRTSGGELGVKASSAGSSGSVTINITNTGEAVEAEATTSQDSRGNTSLDVILTPLKKEIANDIATNGTLLNRASKSAAGLQDAINPNVSRGF